MIEDWRLFRTLRNEAYKYVNKLKQNYFIHTLTQTKSIWHNEESSKLLREAEEQLSRCLKNNKIDKDNSLNDAESICDNKLPES